MKKPILTASLATAGILLGGCMATGAEHRPIVDGSDPAKYESDLAACQQLARQRGYVNAETGTITAASTAVGGVWDGVDGAVAGAVAGGGASAVHTVQQRKAIVINCMRGRGHKVVE